jgi:hypothetical protein
MEFLFKYVHTKHAIFVFYVVKYTNRMFSHFIVIISLTWRKLPLPRILQKQVNSEFSKISSFSSTRRICSYDIIKKNVQRRSFTIPSNETAIVRRYIVSYYIDRCELWGFIREINSGIFTCENISYFPSELLLHIYKCSGWHFCKTSENRGGAVMPWSKALQIWYFRHECQYFYVVKYSNRMFSHFIVIISLTWRKENILFFFNTGRYIVSYYIDRCELWRFIREINSGIFTCENISFCPPELLLHSYKCK